MIASSWPSPISSIEPRLLSSRLCAPAIRSKLNSEAKAPLLGTTNTGTTFVIGAGGSIGCALLQALASNHPRFLILLDYTEQNLHEINLQLAASRKSSYAAVSGDILDGPLMTEISDRYRPPTIRHAAVLGGLSGRTDHFPRRWNDCHERFESRRAGQEALQSRLAANPANGSSREELGYNYRLSELNWLLDPASAST